MSICIRWSTEDQGEVTTLDVQMEACEAFIVSQRFCVVVYKLDRLSRSVVDRVRLVQWGEGQSPTQAGAGTGTFIMTNQSRI